MKIGNLVTILLTAMLILCSCASTAQNKQIQTPVRELASRVLPKQHKNIIFTINEGTEDLFSIESQGNKLHITANSVNSASCGLNYYLKNYCNISVTWYVRDVIEEPSVLPLVEKKVVRNALAKDRFFLNYCTYGYSLNWWQWDDWERLIDWMALNGVNMALATTGQEAVWQSVWRKFGMNDAQIRNYFTGPSYLAWHRMANIDSWHSPLPQSWIDDQLKLQQRIIARERELGIMPIFTSFTGHVPQNIKNLYPEANIRKLNPWGGFEPQYNSYYLSPADSLFTVIQSAYMEEQSRLFGNSHIYGVDPFNELDPPSWEPEYLAEASRLTYESITKSDPEAVWLQMSWVFYHKRKDWTPERLKAYLGVVPKGKLVLLDYYCDKVELWRSTDSFYGQQFIWSYLGNFGGNTMLAGDFKDVSKKLDYAYANAGENFNGIGCTLEGLDVNSFMYEYVLDRAWSGAGSNEQWIEQLADRHIGFADSNFRKAWHILYDKVYCDASGNRAAIVCGRPNIEKRSKWNSPMVRYKNDDLLDAWRYMTLAKRSSAHSYRFDCVNIARQCLENYFGKLYLQSINEYESKDREALALTAARMVEILDDLDMLVSTDIYFLLGKWIADARKMGDNKSSKNYFERDARNILTTWGGRGYSLNDYANRSWSGLLSSYYKPRWECFYRELSTSLESGTPFDQKAFDEQMFTLEWDWVDSKTKFPDKATGDFYSIFTKLYDKYAVEIATKD